MARLADIEFETVLEHLVQPQVSVLVREGDQQAGSCDTCSGTCVDVTGSCLQFICGVMAR